MGIPFPDPGCAFLRSGSVVICEPQSEPALGHCSNEPCDACTREENHVTAAENVASDEADA